MSTEADFGVVEDFPDDLTRELCRASGEVADARRFVQFLYILLRDHVNAHVVSFAYRRSVTPSDPQTAAWASECMRSAPEWFPAPNRLVDAPNDRVQLFLVHLCALVRETSDLGAQMPRKIAEALKATPARDDIHAIYSNGWLARYCQWIVDKLVAEAA